MSEQSRRFPVEVQGGAGTDGTLVPGVVVRARMDLDVSRPHPEEGYAEYPWVGDIVVQWEEQPPGRDPVLHQTVVWTSPPRWDAPGYSSDDAEDLARRDAARRLAEVLSQLCRGEEGVAAAANLRGHRPGAA